MRVSAYCIFFKTNLQYSTTYTVTGHVVFIDGTTSTTGSTTVTTCSNLYNITLSNKNIDFALKGYDMRVYGYNVTAGTNIPLTGVNNNYWGMGVRVTLNKAAGSNAMTMKVTTHLRHWDGWPAKLSASTTVNLNNIQTIEYYYRYVFYYTDFFGKPTDTYGGGANTVRRIDKNGTHGAGNELSLWKKNGVVINNAQNSRIHCHLYQTRTYKDDPETYVIEDRWVDLDNVIFVSNWREKDTNDCYFRGYIGIKIDNAAGTITVGNVTNKIV